MSKHLKQKRGSSNCLAVVAAMAFDCTVEEFEQYWNYKAPYHTTQFMIFGLTKGYLAGVSIRFNEGITFPDDLEIVNIKVPFMERGLPFHAAVVSETNPKLEHAIYFDGEKILDPNPNVSNGRLLSEYKVIDIQFIEPPSMWFSSELRNSVQGKIL